MTPARASDLHAAAFAGERGWSPEEIASLLESPGVRMLSRPDGFALVRTVARETELLTVVVDPAKQRRGIGGALLREWLATAEADEAFLEVAVDNAAARHLYDRLGFAEISRRAKYYSRPGADAVDALLLRREVTTGQNPQSGHTDPKTG